MQNINLKSGFFSTTIKALLFMAGVSFIFNVKNELHTGYKSYKWPSAEAVIIESCIKTNENTKTQEKTYSPYVKYSYSVEGKSYENDKINFISAIKGEKKAKKYTSRYISGSKTRVFYSPEDPSVSVLEKGIKPASVMEAVSGAFLAVFSIVIFRLRQLLRKFLFGLFMMNSGIAIMFSQADKIKAEDMDIYSLESALFNGSGFLLSAGGYKLCKPVLIDIWNKVRQFRK